MKNLLIVFHILLIITLVGCTKDKGVYVGEEKEGKRHGQGTVTYSNGYISITSFLPDSFSGSTIDFTITPASNDLVPVRNQIFEIANTNITIVMQDDAETGTSTTTTTTSSTTTGTTTGSSTTY